MTVTESESLTALEAAIRAGWNTGHGKVTRKELCMIALSIVGSTYREFSASPHAYRGFVRELMRWEVDALTEERSDGRRVWAARGEMVRDREAARLRIRAIAAVLKAYAHAGIPADARLMAMVRWAWERPGRVKAVLAAIHGARPLTEFWANNVSPRRRDAVTARSPYVFVDDQFAVATAD